MTETESQQEKARCFNTNLPGALEQRRIKHCFSVDMGGGKSSVMIQEQLSPTLTTTHYGEPAVCYACDIFSEQVTGEICCSLTTASGLSRGTGPKVILQKAIGCDLYNGKITDDITCSLTTRQGSVGASGPSVIIKCFSEKRFFEYEEDEISLTLRNKGGSFGGGSETVVIEKG